MKMMASLQALLESIIAYFGAFNWDEVLASVQLVLGNINWETFQTTFAALKDVFATIAALLG